MTDNRKLTDKATDDNRLSDIAKIAAGLTRAQRAILLGNRRACGFGLQALVRDDPPLMAYRKISTFEAKLEPTPLGLAVRAHIQENGK